MTRRIPSKATLFLFGTLAASLSLAYVVQHRDGYKDTPILPGQKWHVHDSDRPYPAEVKPGLFLGDPPSDAEVLFDGKDMSHWIQTDNNTQDGNPMPPKWKLVEGCIQVTGGSGNLFSKEKYGDCQLHVEWREDPNVQGFGQSRGNSGVFLMSRYEVQVLDSYHAPTYADGQAGAIYGQWPPLVNPMRRPGEWQAYDIVFESPKFDGDKLVSPAYLTVFFNGVLIHNHQKLNGPTEHRAVILQTPQPAEDRIYLQDHNDAHPMRFRNIWIRRLKDYDQPEK